MKKCTALTPGDPHPTDCRSWFLLFSQSNDHHEQEGRTSRQRSPQTTPPLPLTPPYTPTHPLISSMDYEFLTPPPALTGSVIQCSLSMSEASRKMLDRGSSIMTREEFIGLLDDAIALVGDGGRVSDGDQQTQNNKGTDHPEEKE